MKEKKSAFRYKNLRLVKLKFSGLRFDGTQEDDEEISISTKTNIVYIEKDIAIVNLQIKIGEEEKSAFVLEAAMNAFFNWDEGVNHESLLKANAPALLFSFFRPIVTTVTAQAGFSGVYLPFIDFSQHEAEVMTLEELKARQDDEEL